MKIRIVNRTINWIRIPYLSSWDIRETHSDLRFLSSVVNREMDSIIKFASISRDQNFAFPLLRRMWFIRFDNSPRGGHREPPATQTSHAACKNPQERITWGVIFIVYTGIYLTHVPIQDPLTQLSADSSIPWANPSCCFSCILCPISLRTTVYFLGRSSSVSESST